MIFKRLYNPGLEGRLGIGVDALRSKAEHYEARSRRYVSQQGYVPASQTSLPYLVSDVELGRRLVAYILGKTGASMTPAAPGELGLGTAGMALPFEKRGFFELGWEEKAEIQVQLHEGLHILHPDWSEAEVRKYTRLMLPFDSILPPGFN